MKPSPTRNILLNPGPATTTDSVKYSMVVPDICPREREFGDLMLRVSEKLVKVAHGEKEYHAVMFGGSGTAAVEACISSVVPREKKMLIIDNGAYGRRMTDIAHIHDIDTVLYSIPSGTYPILSEVEELLKKHQGYISHLAMVHHETTTGMLNPLKDTIALAGKYGVEVIVDAMSSFAGIPIDLNSMKPHYLISSSNKCLQGMPGISFVICKKTSLNALSTTPPRSLYLNLYQQHTHLQEKKQLPFTPPVQTFYALEKALDEYFLETEKKHFCRYKENYLSLFKGLSELGFSFLIPEEYQSGLLISVKAPTNSRYSFEDMHDYFYAKGYTIYPGKVTEVDTFRLSVIGQIYKSDIENFLHELKTFLSQKKLLGNLYP
jgi:2-aminoethylphosphonate aminotransferase